VNNLPYADLPRLKLYSKCTLLYCGVGVRYLHGNFSMEFSQEIPWVRG